MIKCPECKHFNVEFDNHFQRPRCYSCGWLPEEKNIHSYHLFDLCDQCFGYVQLRGKFGYCDKCDNHGRVLNSVGKEVIEVFKEHCDE